MNNFTQFRKNNYALHHDFQPSFEENTVVFIKKDYINPRDTTTLLVVVNI